MIARCNQRAKGLVAAKLWVWPAMSEERAIKLMKWGGFTVIASLLPLLFLFLSLVFTAKEYSLGKVLGSGELLLTSWVLGLAAAAELIPDFGSKKLLGVACFVVTIIASFICLGVFMLVRYGGANPTFETITSWLSIFLFLAVLGSSCGCIALSEV